MFSGIIETQSRILAVSAGTRDLLRIEVERPKDFDDVRIGDSIATDGVCLTVEALSSGTMTFALGAETLKITQWTKAWLDGRRMNLERSLRASDRIHGHIVSGHVDATGVISEVRDLGGSVLLSVKAPPAILRYVWQKGSWTVNGVSLTVNSVRGDEVEMCLIPETLRRTNLGNVKVGDRVNLEADTLARGLMHHLDESLQNAPRTAGNGKGN